MLASWIDHTKTRQQWSLTRSSLLLAEQLNSWQGTLIPSHGHGGSKFCLLLHTFASLVRETANNLTSFLACWLLRPRAQTGYSKCACAHQNAIPPYACAVYIINALYLTMTSSCLQSLPFHSSVYNTFYVCKYVLWMEDNRIGCSWGLTSLSPLLVIMIMTLTPERGVLLLLCTCRTLFLKYSWS